MVFTGGASSSIASDVIAPAATPSLIAHTTLVPADHPYATADLLSLVPANGALAWVRDGEGLIGWGETARLVVRGRERFSRAQRWWIDVIRHAEVTDEVKVPGSGIVAFASFAFEPGRSVVVIPHILVGRSGDKTWVTAITDAEEPLENPLLLLTPREESAAVGDITWEEGTQPIAKWQRAISEVVEKISRGEVDKVVLARDVVARSTKPIDVRNLLTKLSSAYSECWAFAVDGLVGATPEMLVKRRGDQVTSRVLAGTVRRGEDKNQDANLAEALLASDKDQEEHEYAVSSVAQALANHCTNLDVPDEPRLLRLANVQHLATDITGLLADEIPVLTLAASLHPTAAVCGTPTERAANIIRALEGMDRNRYAGPVGWMDATGDGEFGIALRCGEIDPDDSRRIRLFAGCGIVAGSDPISELAESAAKLKPMRQALGCD
jgi:menaquinone-specific isochorismate synthase